ncbi:inorganic phosphate transporter [Chlamydiia bacterium]|nr:inorganic phosphate transporter [Chlamydiia bacterium]
MEEVYVICAFIVALYLSLNIGANDVANTVGTGIGSGAVTWKQAFAIAAVCEFLGASTFGHHVTETLQGSLVDFGPIANLDGVNILLGILCSMIATGLWLNLASWLTWPISTTHTIVGATIGVAYVMGGSAHIQFPMFFKISMYWIITPVISMFLAGVIVTALRSFLVRLEQPFKVMWVLAPILTSATILSFAAIFVSKQSMFMTHPILAMIILGLLGVLGLVLGYWFCYVEAKKPLTHYHSLPLERFQKSLEETKRYLKMMSTSSKRVQRSINARRSEVADLSATVDQFDNTTEKVYRMNRVEHVFVSMQWITLAMLAFGHGANDVSNAVAPVKTILEHVYPSLSIGSWWLPLFGSVGIILGLMIWGWRVVGTISKNITTLTPLKAFSAEIACAMTVLTATWLKMPVSTTHAMVGAIIGIGLATNYEKIDSRLIWRIVQCWVITVPAGAIMAGVLYWCLSTVM